MSFIYQSILGCLSGFSFGRCPTELTDSESSRMLCNATAVTYETASLLGLIEPIDPSTVRSCCVMCLPNLLALPARGISCIDGMQPIDRKTQQAIIIINKINNNTTQAKEVSELRQIQLGKIVLLDQPRYLDKLISDCKIIPQEQLAQFCFGISFAAGCALGVKAGSMLATATTSHLYACCSCNTCIPSLTCLKTSVESAGLFLRSGDLIRNAYYHKGVENKEIVFECNLSDFGVEIQIDSQEPVRIGNKALSLCIEKMLEYNDPEQTHVPEEFMKFFQIILDPNQQNRLLALQEIALHLKDSHYPFSATVEDLRPSDFEKFQRAAHCVSTPAPVITQQPRQAVDTLQRFASLPITQQLLAVDDDSDSSHSASQSENNPNHGSFSSSDDEVVATQSTETISALGLRQRRIPTDESASRESHFRINDSRYRPTEASSA